MTRAAIMQPTFLPWLGYFALLDRADVFVYLDDVQLARRSWQVRNRVATPNGVVTLSLSVAGKPSRPLLADTRLADTGQERKLLATLGQALAGAPFAAPVEALVRRCVETAEGSLARLNVSLIEGIAAMAGIGGTRVRASELGVPPAEKAERLLAICERVGADEYLSAIGSVAYLTEHDPFEASAVRLRFLDYEHPRYERGGRPFESHLAAVDALAWVGPERFASLVRSGVRPALTLAEATARTGEEA